MNVFVSEYLCSGSCEWAAEEASLLTEGTAMLAAVVNDLLAIPDCRVTVCLQETFRQSRHPLMEFEPQQQLEIYYAQDPAEEQRHFDRACRSADVVWIIAPEFDSLLVSRIARARQFASRVLGPDAATLQLTADKWELSQFLNQHNLPTIPTALLSEAANFIPGEFPCLIKHRFGAGGLGLQIISEFDAWQEKRSAAKTDNGLCNAEFIVQPFLPGKSFSTVVLTDGLTRTVFPIGTQQICWDAGFEYQGGIIPAELDPVLTDSITNLISAVCDRLPGLVGYVGFDILVPDQRPATPLLVEINPRLTTSYVGYRRLTLDNLAERIVNGPGEFPTIQWQRDLTVRFQPDGCVVLTPSES